MIFYLSCTGNTKWAAEILAKATSDRLIDMSAESHHEAYQVLPGERIGFCFPVHGWRPPKLVRDFVHRLCFHFTDAATPFCYALCTAGDTVGEAMKIFKSDLSECGIHVDSCASLLMPESYVGLPFMDVDTPANELRKKKQAGTDLKTFAKEIAEKKRGINRLHIGRWPRINSRIIGEVFVRSIITDKYFKVNEDKCLRCGKCAKVCPMHNIVTDSNGLPEWLHTNRCLACFACYHHCPARAIEYGRRTKGKGQYFYRKTDEHKTK